MLFIVENNETNIFTQQVSMLLLNSLSGQVDIKQKQLLGILGAVEKLMKRITEKFNQGVCDAVMELG